MDEEGEWQRFVIRQRFFFTLTVTSRWYTVWFGSNTKFAEAQKWKKKKKKKEEEEKHTILSYVDPYKATSDQYVFSWPSAEIQAGQSHFLKAGVSDKPIREQKHS